MAKPEPLLSYLTRTVGVWRAAKVAGYMVCWGIYASQRPDERHTVAGCGEFWRRSEATMWREQREFRKAFPEEENPERIWVLAELKQQKNREKATAELLLQSRSWASI